MDNLTFTHCSSNQLPTATPLLTCYEHATKTIVVLDENSSLHFITHDPKTQTIQLRNSTNPIEELQGQQVALLSYIVDSGVALLFTEEGAILTVNEDGLVDIKAQNDDGITGGSVSPGQDYIYVVTNNNTLIQLDMEFDMVKEVPLDDHPTEKAEGYKPRFSWKADGSFFAINIQTDIGRKCHTRDEMMGIFRSPSLSDPDPEGLVQSVSEKSRANMNQLVSWQPSGSIIAGSDFINLEGKKINRVIFWEKNTLRHLEFNLPQDVTDVLNLEWTADSQILVVDVMRKDSTRCLYFYYRANYYWYLKQSLKISQATQYLMCRHKSNSIIVIEAGRIRIISFEMGLGRQSWKNAEQEVKSPSMIHYSVDGNILKISDYSKGLIPPPMCHREVQFKGNILAVDSLDAQILVISEQKITLYNWATDSHTDYNIEDPQLFNCITNLDFFTNTPQPLFQINNNQVFTLNNENKALRVEQPVLARNYHFTHKQGHTNITEVQLDQNGRLQVEGLTITQNCSSFIFYHEFLIFTVSTSDMYDRLYVLDLALNGSLIEDGDEEKIKRYLHDMESQKLLNVRSVERGARIICCTKNRVVFALPRGNLQAIFPKVVMIKHVKKCMEDGRFQQAFETIRTHKLDLNLLYDLNPAEFGSKADKIVLGFGKSDYINLFVSQLKDEVSTELQYCLPQAEIDANTSYIHVKLEGKKVQQVCQIVSSTLRSCNSDRYILSIFTSDIKMGKLNEVLFEIKQMKQNDVEVEVPPHIQPDQLPHPKKLSSQQILEYVCWLVDANAIYEASLLTYDLQLAAMTARCTQMDPKEYIPYLESLKEISDAVQLRKKICLDLKKYDIAVRELSLGNEQQKQFSIGLIEKYKLFKCGLKVYDGHPVYLKRVKLIVIEQLLKATQTNQAYKLALSIPDFDKAMEIALKSADGHKIKQILQNSPTLNEEQRQARAIDILKQIGQDGFKDKTSYAKLLCYVKNYDEAVKTYLNCGNYQKAFKYYNKISHQFRESGEFREQMKLIFSLHKNLLIKEKNLIIQKQDRLAAVHKNKSHQGETFTTRDRENDDMYSEVSVSSKTGSSYTISTTTGMRKKKDKKRSILSRNIKEGSLLEEEYLVALLFDAKTRIDQHIRDTKLLIQHLIYLNLIEEAEILRNLGNEYAAIAKKCFPKYYAQVRFENDHPEFSQLIEAYEDPLGQLKDKEKLKKAAIESFNYLF